ncbi:MAG: CocE/NonD family hydrolase [Actinobacteria bacterium]|nr:CocE/NonD family hydrolase [Actinomycetota bacterium]
MRDGTVLRANVYRPEGEGPWPTLLARLPYGKDRNPEVSVWVDPVEAARQGFMVVVQDTRGRFQSDGKWAPLQFEGIDGYDAVEWAADLPGSNGQVGMYGMSYYGNVQWTAALERPSGLRAIAPAVTWSDPLDGVFARGGAVELGTGLFWSLATGMDQLARLPIAEEERSSLLAQSVDELERLGSDGYWQLPVAELPGASHEHAPDLGTFSVLRDPVVAEWSTIAGRYHEVQMPSLHIGGWYDVFCQGVLDNFSGAAAAGQPTRLVMGPWFHDLTIVADPIGDLCFGAGARALGSPIGAEGDLNDLQLNWFRSYLGGEGHADADSGPPVLIFVMGRNEWRAEEEWPLSRARTTPWYLASQEKLLPEPSGTSEASTEFAYDPGDPVPTLGGPIEMGSCFRRGPLEQSRVEARDDVLLFTSASLPEDLEVTGRVRAFLHVASSAPSTDWVVRLCDVHPDGRSFPVCDGIRRLASGATELQRVEIDLWSTSHVFLAGHRLRLQVTSSCFPRWDRNMNTGDQMDPDWQLANQQLLHDAERPSFIELPVVPNP